MQLLSWTTAMISCRILMDKAANKAANSMCCHFAHFLLAFGSESLDSELSESSLLLDKSQLAAYLQRFEYESALLVFEI
jgi:hypothetical protein